MTFEEFYAERNPKLRSYFRNKFGLAARYHHDDITDLVADTWCAFCEKMDGIQVEWGAYLMGVARILWAKRCERRVQELDAFGGEMQELEFVVGRDGDDLLTRSDTMPDPRGEPSFLQYVPEGETTRPRTRNAGPGADEFYARKREANLRARQKRQATHVRGADGTWREREAS